MAIETKSFTDTIFQRVRLYIEGVEVPWASISITCGIGGLPEANITIPAQAGLMDIARFYSPKVHIFYTDRIKSYEDDKEADKLLFSGLIAQVHYNKSKAGSGNVGISFRCVHRYHLINEMIIDYSGWLNGDPLNQNPGEGSIKADTANSASTIIEAMAGIKDPTKEGGSEITLNSPEGQTNILPERYKEFYTRLQGMPGVIVNFWNQMKRSAFNRFLKQNSKYYSEGFIKIHQPLVEDGLEFFDRLAGHWPIEAIVQADEYRIDPCPETPDTKEKIVIPPARQLFLQSSIQAEMTVSNIATYLQNSGEQTTIYEVFTNFYDSIDYEMVTLSSPAEAPIHIQVQGTEGDEFKDVSGSAGTYAVDTIVKPKIPFYFSPTCNVLFPNMYHTINVMYDELGTPTRVNLRNMEGPGQDGFRTSFRAPHSVREAIAKKVAGANGAGGYDMTQPYGLAATLASSYGAIGQFEQGRGIKQESGHIPRWLSHFSQSTTGNTTPLKDTRPTDPAKIAALKDLAEGWKKRYPDPAVAKLNPYDIDSSDITAHHRLLFASADYMYTQMFARSKAGSVECPFNPHIVPGYPMDILEANPNYPSFHALCTTVTHTFTPESASTSVGFTAAMTYAEMANYYIPFVSPMIQVALNLAKNPTLLNVDEITKKTADDFYRYTLGVPSILPQEIYNFETNLMLPKKWGQENWENGSAVSVKGANGGELNPMLSYEGNLSMTYREIETKADVEKRFGLKFIDMDPANYSPTVVRYRDKQLDDKDKFEIGRSQWLTYETFFGEPLKKP